VPAPISRCPRCDQLVGIDCRCSQLRVVNGSRRGAALRAIRAVMGVAS
jgi:hypothetical protein